MPPKQVAQRGSNNESELASLADELVCRRVVAIAALGGGATGLAAKRAIAALPIVLAAPNNPVELGVVVSLNRPGGNLTGVTGAKMLRPNTLIPSPQLSTKSGQVQTPRAKVYRPLLSAFVR